MFNVKSIFSKIFKGNEGEADALESISRLLNQSGDEQNYYLIPKLSLDNPYGGTLEVDLLLLHPSLGIYAIEVKNYKNLQMLEKDGVKNPFEQAKTYRQILMNNIQNALGKVPINVEFRVVFPSISLSEADKFFRTNQSYQNYQNHAFFKDDLSDKERFGRFFNASVNVVPNKKELLKIAELLSPKSTKKSVVPIISKDEVVFFDQKQLSVMSGYTDGFRIIRGVAGTGKTMILVNFILNRLQRDGAEKFLVLCFNKNLKENIQNCFGDKLSQKNVAIYTLFGLLKRINFDFDVIKANEKTPINELYERYETDEALAEFRLKLKEHLKTHPIDYVLVDETQDMPAGFMRIIYEELKDCVFFIDEAQKFYSYTMSSIAEVFHHKKFEKINMSGRVKNLKNVYRTPNAIARMAFEILAMDKDINEYYKRSFYLTNGFLSDVELVLDGGNVQVGDYESLPELLNLAKDIKEECRILSHKKDSVNEINQMLGAQTGLSHISAQTAQSVKGLEANTIIIHNFVGFLLAVYHNEKELFYRKAYVLFTRAKSRLIISVPEKLDESLPERIKDVIAKIKLATTSAPSPKAKADNHYRLANLMPAIRDARDVTELVVAGSQLALILAGLWW